MQYSPTHRRRATISQILSVVLFVSLSITATLARAAADSPVVTLASGGAGVPLIQGHFNDVEAIGYQTQEFFIEGTAHAYTSAEPLGPDGQWNAVTPATDTAGYKTRVIVHTPRQGKKFNGTVYVEWLNVSGGIDASPDWVHGHIQVAREGAAYVLVSAQFAGVNQLINGGILPGDPDRYGSLLHPGDSYSYDIFSQAGQAVWDGALIGTLKPKRVIALGESQSAGRLTTYINAVQPLVDVYDGFVVHSRQPGGAALSQPPLANIPVPLTAIRDDIATPVLVFQAEGDVANSLLLARQPETANGNMRLWEVAGTAHFDIYGLEIGLDDIGQGEAEIENLNLMQNPPASPQPGLIDCANGINTGPMHWVFNAAVHWINRWVKYGTPPPIAPRLEAATAPGVAPVVFEEDAVGNVRGGIRTPYLDVPIARLTGSGNTAAPGGGVASGFCFLFGRTIPLTEDELAALYPTHGSYVFAYLFASLEAVKSQYLLWPDALLLLQAAAESDIGK